MSRFKRVSDQTWERLPYIAGLLFVLLLAMLF